MTNVKEEFHENGDFMNGAKITELEEKNKPITRMNLYLLNVEGIIISGGISFLYFISIFFKYYEISFYLGSVGAFLGGFIFFFLFSNYKLTLQNWMELLGLNVLLGILCSPLLFLAYHSNPPLTTMVFGTLTILLFGIIPFCLSILAGNRVSARIKTLEARKRKIGAVVIGSLVSILIIGIYITILLTPRISPWPD